MSRLIVRPEKYAEQVRWYATRLLERDPFIGPARALARASAAADLLYDPIDSCPVVTGPPAGAVKGVPARPFLPSGRDTTKPPQRDRAVAKGMGVRVCATESRQAAGAITGSPDGPTRKGPGPVAHAGTGDTPNGKAQQ